MTKPMYEPSQANIAGNHAYRIRQLERRPAVDTGLPIYCIKVFADLQIVTVGDGKFAFAIDEDVDGLSLSKVEIYVTTASSSGIVQVQIRNKTQGLDMLSTRVQVDANEKHSKDAATAYVINASNADVVHGDEINIDVDAAGTQAKGLGVSLTF